MPGSDARLNPFKKADGSSSHDMYSVHQANELQAGYPALVHSCNRSSVLFQRDLERVAEEIARIKAGDAAPDAGKSMRASPRVVFLQSSGGGVSSTNHTSLLARFPSHCSDSTLSIEAGSGYGEWVVRLFYHHFTRPLNTHLVPAALSSLGP
jgi:hypothetical protein